MGLIKHVQAKINWWWWWSCGTAAYWGTEWTDVSPLPCYVNRCINAIDKFSRWSFHWGRLRRHVLRVNHIDFEPGCFHVLPGNNYDFYANRPTIYFPQLKKIQSEHCKQQRKATREAIRLNELVAYVKKVIRRNCYTYTRKKKRRKK